MWPTLEQKPDIITEHNQHRTMSNYMQTREYFSIETNMLNGRTTNAYIANHDKDQYDVLSHI